MEKHKVRILESYFITHDVKRFRTERPGDYQFIPGQATEVSLNRKGWEDEARPFTFTSLPDEEQLEFTIKTYPSHKGVTNELRNAGEGDELILREVFGAIQYRGQGVFIAGGAGITPFIAILRMLNRDGLLPGNILLFANKRKTDIILKEEFESMLGDAFINILSDEETEEYDHGLVDKKFLRAKLGDMNRVFYICGPPPMIDKVIEHLHGMEVPDENIVREDL